MPDLFSTMNAAAGALRAFQTALDISQNNVGNANTPGFVKQTASLEALAFDPLHGGEGGVQALNPSSTRNNYAEVAVRRQVSLLGSSSQLATTLDPIEQVFDISGKSGIGSALDALFQSFSALSAAPTDTGARNTVISAANQVATAFQQSVAQLSKIRSSVDGDLKSTVDAINNIAAGIASYNSSQRGPGSPDAGLDAKLHASLEQLSEYADVQVLRQDDGTVTVLLGGETPLVMGTQAYKIGLRQNIPDNASNPGATPDIAVVDSSGTDVTSKVLDGRLGALLSVRNQVLPHLIGGPNDTGELNVLASQVADAVNGVLATGSGKPLFAYDPASAGNAAASLAVTPGLSASELSAADPGPPPVTNGLALKLANLSSDTSFSSQQMTFGQTYASLASSIGDQLNRAKSAQDTQTQTVAQARSLRQQVSGVSLDEEATHVMELQRSFQAASRIVMATDEMLQTLLTMAG